jgi:hypothetical protein
MDADRIKELRRKVTLLAQTTLMSELLPITKELLDELEDGDYWRQRATEALENGTCPVCFGGDEGGHEEGCEWGDAETRADGLEFQRDQAQTDLTAAQKRITALLQQEQSTNREFSVFNEQQLQTLGLVQALRQDLETAQKREKVLRGALEAVYPEVVWLAGRLDADGNPDFDQKWVAICNKITDALKGTKYDCTEEVTAIVSSVLHKDLETLQGRGKTLRDTLAELVELKNIKDSVGKTAEYLERQPKAWEAARQALDGSGE